jgi:phage FluMu protein Com
LTIDFNCLHCGKALATSEEKAGRQAKCPQCGEVITVPAATSAAVELLPDEVLDDSVPGMGGQKNCPLCGESIPIAATRCTGCGEPLIADIGGRSTHPRKLEVGDVLSTAWDHFAKHAGVSIGANIINTLLVCLSAVPLLGLGFMVGMLIDQDRDVSPALFISIIPAVFLLLAVIFFLQPGLARIYLGISRGETVDIGQLFSGGRYFVKATLCSILFGAMVMLGLFACLAPGILLALRYWPYLYVIVDEDPPGLECFTRSAKLTEGNWGAVLVLGVVGIAINMAVQAICGVLQFATQPLNSLFFSTAYVKMTGQERLA